MTLEYKAGNIHKSTYGLSRWALPNKPGNLDYVPENSGPQISIEGISITDVGPKFFEKVRESYKQDNNCHILNSPIQGYCKDTSLDRSLDDIWETSYDDGRLHLIDGILYHGSKNTCVMVLCSRMIIKSILLEFHDKIYSGNFSEDRKMERKKTCVWWPSWIKDVI
ncbi:hypothetical protein O181_002844 [Austropuccinia psidii MF-1]|uniref:Uncharacterized protein n=1 Tax=Austropuccinia psidii MF-1 TaxID=1389203 RepID=A0A9Q3BD78_9BASI|nr:hypothetical protein [Austropuccinia psidii MF-1]